MYKSDKRLDREQMIFAVSVILQAAIDVVEEQLPTCTSWAEHSANAKDHGYDPTELTDRQWGAIHMTGIALSIFYAQLADDGLEADVALEKAGLFLETCELCVKRAWADQGQSVKQRIAKTADKPQHIGEILLGYPDARKHAEQFIDTLWSIKQNEQKAE